MTNQGSQAVQSSQQTPGHDATDAPPPYNTSGEGKPPASDSHSARGPSDLPEQPNVEFFLVPDTTAATTHDIEWQALLLVCANDIPQLMKQGFHWNETNIQEGQGYMADTSSMPAGLRSGGWPWARCFVLMDLAEDPQWTALLSVGARELSVLSRFRVSDLSVEKILTTMAWDRKSRMVYSFFRNAPESNCNVYYDDKPLDGWWPWPKQSCKTSEVGAD